MKEKLCTIMGIVGGAVVTALGGWDAGLQALIVCMAVDYISGVIVGGVFKNSTKTSNGALESHIGWKGLCRKGMTLLVVLVAHYIDVVIGTNYVRDAAVIGFMANEIISLVENAGLMGIPLPSAIKKAIDVLTSKSESDGMRT